MKKTILIFGMLFSLVAMAQDTEDNPKLEKRNDMVKATYFHENGQIAQTGYYKNGKLHGEWEAFDENGKKIAMAEYVHGEKTGKWFFWNDDVLKEVNYKDSRVTNVVTWSNATPVVITQ